MIERERRWAVPAAVASMAASLLFLGAVVIQQSAGLYSGSSTAKQIASLDTHSNTLMLMSVVRALAFVAVIGPLLYLFRAAQGRSPRVRPAMVGFVFLGPVLFAAAGIVQGIGITGAASDFVNLPPEPTRTYAEFQQQVKQQPTQIEKVTIYSTDRSLEVQQSNDDFYAVDSFPSDDQDKLTSQLDDASIDNSTESDSDMGPPDAEASHVTEASSTLAAANGLALPAVLALAVAMVYVSLQALRTGLLTRFSGSLGIALGATVIIIPPIVFFSAVLWALFLGWVGLLFLGKVPNGRPPAWETGEAIPWQRPGDATMPTAEGGDAIEGEATEVDGSKDTGTAQPRPQKRKRKSRD